MGHLAVGMAAARIFPLASGSSRKPHTRPEPHTRLQPASVLFWSALSFLPDADVIGFALGVRYADEWGHRGATHSLPFSLALGVAIGLAALFFRRPAMRTGITASIVLASHAFLDTLTDGGLGCALFWPFDLTRYFAPWTPIPVSPIGLGFLSPYGMYVAAVELLIFAPLIWFAIKPRLRPTIPIVLWLVIFWLLLSGDPVRERVVRVLLRDDTVFAQGFSDGKLDAVKRGDTLDDVRAQLGPPLGERQVQGLDSSSQRCWIYSRSPDDGYYRLRVVCFQENRVARVMRRWVRE